MATCKHVNAYRNRQTCRAKFARLQRALLSLWQQDDVGGKTNANCFGLSVPSLLSTIACRHRTPRNAESSLKRRPLYACIALALPAPASITGVSTMRKQRPVLVCAYCCGGEHIRKLICSLKLRYLNA